jgi:hypothetical protein
MVSQDKYLRISYFAVLAGAMTLYIMTCAPGPLWQDAGMYQYRILHNDIEGRLGLALSHPLYHIIGMGVKYMAVGELAYRINLISAVAGAFAVANLFLLLRLWLGRNLPAVMAAATFGLSWTLWQFSTMAEVYTLYLALFVTELILLFKYIKTGRIGFLYVLGFCNGLAVANHMWGVIPFACYVVFLTTLLIQKQIRLKDFGIIAGLWVIGAAPYGYLIIKNVVQTGDFTATLTSAFFGDSWQGAVLNASLSAKLVKENLILMAYNFPTPNVIFFFAGLYGLTKVTPNRSFRNILWALLLLFFIFAFRYTVPDRYAFFVPFYCLVSILIGVGFNLLLAQPNRKVLPWIVLVLALLPVPIYAISPIIAKKVAFKPPTRRNIPYRDDYIWFLRPWRTSHRGPEDFANKALETVEEGAVIYADGTTVYPLLYAQEVKHKRRDVRVVSFHSKRENPVVFTRESLPQLLRDTPVYVVSPAAGYCPRFLLERYSFTSVGVVHRVVKK